MAKTRNRLSEVFRVTLPAPAKTWEYRGCVIEEDFESWADRAPRIFLKTRTGYVIRAANYTEENAGPHVPGKYRTLAEAKRGVDEELKDGGWLHEPGLGLR